MDEKAKEKFLEIQELFKRMSFEEVCPIIESYYIWRTLTFRRSIPEVGKDNAEENAKLMSLHKEFFIPTEQSHLQLFIIGLVKFFDKDSKALSIGNLIKKIQENKNLITPELLKNVYPNLDKIGAIKDDYLPINQDVIDHFRQFQEKHENLISNLKNIRDKQFAHTDMNPIKTTFVPVEIEVLIKNVQEVFNKLSNSFDLSATSWNHLKEDSIRSTDFLLENLRRGEIERKKEIKRKWG